MIVTRETLFDLLLNALLQIGFFAVLAALLSPFVAKAKAKHQYCFYLAVLFFSLGAPVANTFWRGPSNVAPEKSPQQTSSNAVANRISWVWQEHSKPPQHLLPVGFQPWILGAWGVFVLLRLSRFGQAVYRVHRLRREAYALSPARRATSSGIIESNHEVVLLESAAVDEPVTIGVLRPAILLPSKVLPELGERELSAILLHEYSHIRRRDFLTHFICELISLPVAWHPGIAYLMSKVSQTRELACDDYAAARLGNRRSYANLLLRTASLCLHVPRARAAELGIFDGDNLEVRIMVLTKKKLSLSRTRAIVLLLATSTIFGAGAVLAHVTSVQANSDTSKTAEKFAGTWHWMFDGRSFSTMILVPSGTAFTGSVTPSRIMLNDDGSLQSADPAEDSTPSPIAKAAMEGSGLHVTVKDGNETFDFMMTLKDETHAEIRPIGAPPNMKPIAAEKVH